MDVFSLVAKLTLDSGEYDNNLDSAKSSAAVFGDKLKSGLAAAAKVGTAAITVASGAIAALTKESVENYAEYEQLVGGVVTLFKSSADLVQEYAANAYKTAGLSANEYMETVTSFSASLLQSLGGDTEKAAQIGDMAISDMADNANKMGTAMESIQNAYQGFAKQNYTMLDNLKLGYGGTKTEMERLLADATALSGIDYDIESLSDVYKAIHVIQESLDITGTTAKEASETISGSLAATKSAWDNLVTGVADENANFGELVDNFVDSVATVGENIIPRVEQALTGIGQLVEGLAPVIVNAVPTLVADVLPKLLSSAASLVESIGGAIIDNLPVILETGLELILTLANGIAESLPELIPTIVDVVLQIVDTLTEPDTLGALLEASVAIIIALADGLIRALPKLLAKAPVIIKNFVTAIGLAATELVKAAAQMILTLVTGLIDSLPEIYSTAVRLVNTFVEGIREKLTLVVTIGRIIIDSVGNGIKSMISSAATWGQDLMDNFIGGIKAKFAALSDAVSSAAQMVKDFIGFSEPKKGPLSNFHTYAPDMMRLYAQGIRDNEKLVRDQIDKSFDFGTRTVDFAASGIGMSSAAMINGISGAAQAENGIGPVTIELVTANGMQLARWLLPDLIDAARASGTPIANPA